MRPGTGQVFLIGIKDAPGYVFLLKSDGELYRFTDNDMETVDGFWIEIL